MIAEMGVGNLVGAHTGVLVRPFVVVLVRESVVYLEGMGYCGV